MENVVPDAAGPGQTSLFLDAPWAVFANGFLALEIVGKSLPRLSVAIPWKLSATVGNFRQFPQRLTWPEISSVNCRQDGYYLPTIADQKRVKIVSRCAESSKIQTLQKPLIKLVSKAFSRKNSEGA